MGLKTYGGGGGCVCVEFDVCDTNKAHQVFAQFLHPTCSLLRARGKETLRHIARTQAGKDRVTHADKVPRHRQNAGKCKSQCFSCSGFIHHGGTETTEKQIFSYRHLCSLTSKQITAF